MTITSMREIWLQRKCPRCRGNLLKALDEWTNEWYIQCLMCSRQFTPEFRVRAKRLTREQVREGFRHG